jgi:hypothetical protein
VVVGSERLSILLSSSAAHRSMEKEAEVMENRQLFNESPFFSTDKLFTEVVSVTYKIDYEYLFNYIKDLPHGEYLIIRQKIISFAVLTKAVVDTEAAKQKYWERIISQLESQFKFQRPQIYKSDAERMRRIRGGI